MQEIPLEHITRFQIVNNGYKLEFSAVDDELTWLHKHVRLSHFLAEWNHCQSDNRITSISTFLVLIWDKTVSKTVYTLL